MGDWMLDEQTGPHTMSIEAFAERAAREHGTYTLDTGTKHKTEASARRAIAKHAAAHPDCVAWRVEEYCDSWHVIGSRPCTPAELEEWRAAARSVYPDYIKRAQRNGWTIAAEAA